MLVSNHTIRHCSRRNSDESQRDSVISLGLADSEGQPQVRPSERHYRNAVAATDRIRLK